MENMETAEESIDHSYQIFPFLSIHNLRMKYVVR
jgi:hypothetical protein